MDPTFSYQSKPPTADGLYLLWEWGDDDAQLVEVKYFAENDMRWRKMRDTYWYGYTLRTFHWHGPILTSNPPPVYSTFVTVVTITDPDTGNDVEVEIRKLRTGAMVGLDASYLEQLADNEQPWSPYDYGVRILVPDGEEA